MQADRNSIGRILIFLALLFNGLGLQAMDDSIPLVLSPPEGLSAFQNSPWILLPDSVAGFMEAPPVVSTSVFFGTPHLLPAGEINPLPLNDAGQADWVLWVLLAGLGGIALAHLLFPLRTRQFFRATLGGPHFSQMEREGGFFDEPPFWLMFTNYLLMVSLLIFLTIQHAWLNQTPGEFREGLIFLGIFGALIVYYPLKRMMTSFLAWVFHTHETNEAYMKNMFLFNNLAGILILPFVIYLAYSPGFGGLYLVWGMVVLLNMGKVFRGAVIGFQQPGFSMYYLILYLCAVELAPLLILAKAASNVLNPL